MGMMIQGGNKMKQFILIAMDSGANEDEIIKEVNQASLKAFVTTKYHKAQEWLYNGMKTEIRRVERGGNWWMLDSHAYRKDVSYYTVSHDTRKHPLLLGEGDLNFSCIAIGPDEDEIIDEIKEGINE